jgi:hypothetical protein
MKLVLLLYLPKLGTFCLLLTSIVNNICECNKHFLQSDLHSVSMLHRVVLSVVFLDDSGTANRFHFKSEDCFTLEDRTDRLSGKF